jgi:hypothetical protein
MPICKGTPTGVDSRGETRYLGVQAGRIR